MGILRILGGFAGNRLRRILTFTERYRKHRYTLRRAAISPQQIKMQQRQTWWGNEARWYPGGTPPRNHNRVIPLIDGENFFQELEQALSQAKDYVFICGWSFTPYVPLGRTTPSQLIDSRLLTVLNEVARHAAVRILLWNGAPFLFQPDTRQTETTRKLIETEGQGDLKCYLDKSAPLTHCHHQKAVVIDGRVAFVGGMDLTTFLGDRYDTSKHSLRSGLNWHDVQLKIEGEAVADVENNFRQRWLATLEQTKTKAKKEDALLPQRAPELVEQDWSTPVQIVRTIPRHLYKFAPRGEFGIFHAYTSLIAGANHFIYLENNICGRLIFWML